MLLNVITEKSVWFANDGILIMALNFKILSVMVAMIWWFLSWS